MPWWARTWFLFQNSYQPSLYFYIRPGNWRKQMLWSHGAHSISISPPEYMFCFMSLLTTARPLGDLLGSLLGLLQPLLICTSWGEGQRMQVSDNLSLPHTGALTHNPSFPTLKTSFPIHRYIYIPCYMSPFGFRGCTGSVDSTLSHTPSLLPTSPLSYSCSTILSHAYSYT